MSATSSSGISTLLPWKRAESCTGSTTARGRGSSVPPRAIRGEETVAEGVHPPDRCVGLRAQSLVPVPAGDGVHDAGVARRDRDRYVVPRAGTGHDGRGRVVTEHDQHEVVVAVRRHEPEEGVEGVLDRVAVRGPDPRGRGQMSPADGSCSGMPSYTEPSPTADWSISRGVRDQGAWLVT